MRTMLLSLVAAALLLDGYVHGLWTDRWKNSPELDQAAAKLDRVPLTLGEWRGQARELEARTVTLAGFTAYLNRSYQRSDGSVVTVLLACGRSGPLSVHTPEVCYAGAGYSLAGPAVNHVVPGGELSPPPEFWKGKFSKQDAVVPMHQRVFWSWYARGAWKAPSSPRWSFAGLPVLHKLYVTCQLTGTDERQEDAVCAEFMGQFLPAVEKALFAKE
ncbi:MAG TPA: exosortase-associated EpsI family protein [Gemmataceae bacterium]|nr:exosortase-associated EpsI family protein [Gemmataceae bacterium]